MPHVCSPPASTGFAWAARELRWCVPADPPPANELEAFLCGNFYARVTAAALSVQPPNIPCAVSGLGLGPGFRVSGFRGAARF